MESHNITQKAVVVNPQGEILTLRRTKTAPSNPLAWDLPGGQLELGEDPIASIIREVAEETGLIVESPKVFDVEAHTNKGGDYWITIAYRVKADGEIILSYEHDMFRWVTADQFLELASTNKLRRFINFFKEDHEIH